MKWWEVSPCVATSNSSIPQRVSLDVEDADRLAGREPPQARDADLDHEAAAGLEVRGDVAEARDLRRLRRQVHDRVEDEVRDGERPRHRRRREVADRDADLLAARLRAEPRRHRLRQLDPVHRHAALGQRERDPAGADPELERAAAPGELGEQVDGRVDDRRRRTSRRRTRRTARRRARRSSRPRPRRRATPAPRGLRGEAPRRRRSRPCRGRPPSRSGSITSATVTASPTIQRRCPPRRPSTGRWHRDPSRRKLAPRPASERPSRSGSSPRLIGS